MINDKRKNLVIVTMITIIVIILGVLGASYAYFQGSIAGNGLSNIKTIANSLDNLVFTPGSDITITANQSNFGSGSGNRSGSTTSTVTLTARNDASSTHYYRMYLLISENTFVYTNGTTPELTLTVTKNGTTVINAMDVTTTNGVIDIPVSSGSTVSKQPITASAGSTTTDTWVATVTFVNLNSNQNENVGKGFRAVLYMDNSPMLPSEYQEVEYITFSGAQRLSTGFYLNPSTDGFDLKFKASTVSQNGMIIADTGGNVTTGSYIWVYYYNAGNKVGTWTKAGSTTGSPLDTNTHITKMLSKKVYFDNRLTKDWTSTTFGTPDYEMLVGAGYYNANYSYYFKGNVYSVIFYRNNEEAMHLIPCYRKSDSVIGMYDLVNGEFYINNGSGTFGKGSNST